jgi:hypothetical protein
MYFSMPGAVNSNWRSERRFSSVFGWLMLANCTNARASARHIELRCYFKANPQQLTRLPTVLVLSSAANKPLPGVAIMRALAISSSTLMHAMLACPDANTPLQANRVTRRRTEENRVLIRSRDMQLLHFALGFEVAQHSASYSAAQRDFESG